ncbi:GNAT family N-acetyltransferase [Shewanella sp. NIFS-20-20]|uniref:GNAT family N-acetyltransferase n=1 Tax=Shewanella sp. NIFS-20-20 TaxID=2853806 RepID=UPI001C48A47D|nr:GNAT family N-acetyltransferase [Shewanella sp. NIFS-20-20]
MNDKRVVLVEATIEQHGQAILVLMNDAILNSSALYDIEPRQPAFLQQWFEQKRQHGWPIIVAMRGDDVAGFGSYGQFRPFAANRFTVEHSLYVCKQHQGIGVGKHLLSELITRATHAGMRTMVAAIDSDNQASISLHLSQGFVYKGELQQVAYKFDRWLTTHWYQKLLNQD